jgi:hypothetical protein
VKRNDFRNEPELFSSADPGENRVSEDVMERRRFPRTHFELAGNHLYRQGCLVFLPPAAIRSALLERLERQLWTPDFPTTKSVPIGDDVATQILGHAQTLGYHVSP